MHAGLLALEPDEAGMHVVGLPVDPAGFDDRAVARAAGVAGVIVQSLSRHYAASGGRSGLMFGYTGVAPERMAPALETLAQVLRAAPDKAAAM
jgi:DNA-binding transcriptional MocR family regulator